MLGPQEFAALGLAHLSGSLWPSAGRVARRSARPTDSSPVSDRLGSTFDGRPFTRASARALADCEGDDLLDWGGLPSGYVDEGSAALDWGDIKGVVPGYVYIVVQRANRYTLYILADSAELMGLPDIDTYCGWPIVTSVRVRAQAPGAQCDDDEADMINAWFRWHVVVRRADAATGDLQKVVRASLVGEILIPNEEHPAGLLFEVRLLSGVYGSDYGERAGAPTSDRTAVRPGFWPLLAYDQWVFGCEGVPGAVTSLFRTVVGQLITADWVAEAEAAGSFLGPSSADSPHALYLVRSSGIPDTTADWVGGVCELCPWDCDDPIGPVDDEDPGQVVGP